MNQTKTNAMSAMSFTDKVVDYTNNLLPFAINLTKDKESAQDLLQETVYRAITNEDKYQTGTNLKAWLFTIMRNIFINNYRKNQKRNTLIDTTENLYLINNAGTIIKNQSSANFVMEDLMKAVNNLSDDFRIPFVMHYEGFKYHEIADKLDLPLGTVKSRIFFARKELKSKLKPYNKENRDK